MFDKFSKCQGSDDAKVRHLYKYAKICQGNA